MREMLSVCDSYAAKFDITFNASKSKYIREDRHANQGFVGLYDKFVSCVCANGLQL